MPPHVATPTHTPRRSAPRGAPVSTTAGGESAAKPLRWRVRRFAELKRPPAGILRSEGHRKTPAGALPRTMVPTLKPTDAAGQFEDVPAAGNISWRCVFGGHSVGYQSVNWLVSTEMTAIIYGQRFGEDPWRHRVFEFQPSKNFPRFIASISRS